MQATRRRDTSAELRLRRHLHGLGLRYRVDHPVLPGSRRRPDVVFTRSRVAVFVDGCFWHVCPIHASAPRSNAEWWQAKLMRNVERDRDTDTALAAAGWLVIRVWEHADPADAAAGIADAVRARSLPATSAARQEPVGSNRRARR